MRRLLLALPFALLPLVAAQAHDDHDHAHGTLGAHEHGVATLNVVLDGNTLELELDSPAMNLVGFEHAATRDTDKAKVAAVRQQLEQPLKLFGVDQAAGCTEDAQNSAARCLAMHHTPTTMTSMVTSTGMNTPTSTPITNSNA